MKLSQESIVIVLSFRFTIIRIFTIYIKYLHGLNIHSLLYLQHNINIIYHYFNLTLQMFNSLNI